MCCLADSADAGSENGFAKSGYCISCQAVLSLQTVKVEGQLTLSYRSLHQVMVPSSPHHRWVISCAVLDRIWLPLLLGLAHFQSAEEYKSMGGQLTLSHRSLHQVIVTRSPHHRWVISCAMVSATRKYLQAY